MRSVPLWLLLTLPFGCEPSPADTPVVPTEPSVAPQPTSEDWGDDDITCSVTADCLHGEACDSGVCQVERCTETYTSVAPLGHRFVFLSDREFAVADTHDRGGRYFLDGYAPEAWGAYSDDTWEAADRRIEDVASGDFLGAAVEAYAVVRRRSHDISVIAMGGHASVTLDAGFAPIALDAGDVDADGLEELVAASADELVVCHADEGRCDILEVPGEILDVAVGDVDGDVRREVVLLLADGDERSLYIHNLDHEETVQVPFTSLLLDLEAEAVRLTTGDIDGDQVAEIIVLADGGLFGAADDELAIYEVSSTWDDADIEHVWTSDAEYGRLMDLVAGDMDADGVDEVIAVHSASEAVVYRLDGVVLSEVYNEPLDATADPDRIAMADHDADSVRAVLTPGEPETVAGAILPTTVLVLPPYWADHSGEDHFQAHNGFGESTSVSEEFSDSVSLGLNVDWGSTRDVFGLFSLEMNKKLEHHIDETRSNTDYMTIGSRWHVVSDPRLFGDHTGGVVMSWGCFHGYTYAIEDPGDVLGSDGSPVVLAVPVDGGTAMWSTPRYNALASALGDLPIITIPYTTGAADSYPSTPRDLDGRALDDDQIVFPDLDWYEVSDVGFVEWEASVGREEANETTTTTSFGRSARIKVGGFQLGVGMTEGSGDGYRLSLGEGATFYGGIPPVVDDPATQADEYSDNRYRMSPLVYLSSWTDDQGNEAAYYVSSFIVR